MAFHNGVPCITWTDGSFPVLLPFYQGTGKNFRRSIQVFFVSFCVCLTGLKELSILKNDPRAGTPLLWGKAERAKGCAAWRREGSEETLVQPRNSLLWGWWGPGTGCPEKLWLPPPWQCSRPGWTGLWPTWSGGKCPCPWQGGCNEMICEVAPEPNHSVILWLAKNRLQIVFGSIEESECGILGSLCATWPFHSGILQSVAHLPCPLGSLGVEGIEHDARGPTVRRRCWRKPWRLAILLKQWADRTV